MKKSLCSLLCIALLLCSCSAGAPAPGSNATPDAAVATPDAAAAPTEPFTEPPTEPPTTPPTPQERAQEQLDAILAAEGCASKGSVEAPEILQYPDLPTGCEAVAATIALNALGCELNAVDFARNWLIRGDDIVRSFVGDPFEWGGAGIFPPGLCASVQRYIDASGAELAVFDLTGAPMDALYRLIDAGVPVVVWSTYYLSEPRIESSYTYDGHTVYWYENEHCLCLCGYDTAQGTVTLSDPIQGIVQENAAVFESVYQGTGQMAMAILRTEN